MFGRSGFLIGLLFLLGAWIGTAAADSASWQSHNTAGLQALQEGDVAAAVEQFEAAFSLATDLSTADPTLGALLNNLIFAYISAAQYDDAKRAMNLWVRIIASNPDAPWAGEQLGALQGLVALLKATEPREAAAAPQPDETPPSEAPVPAPPSETPPPVLPTERLAAASPTEAPALDTPAETPPPATTAEVPAPETPTEAPAAAPPAETRFAIHLASLRSEEAAETEWRTLQKRHPEQLGHRKLITTEITLSDKGTFVRVLTGPFESRAPAEALCKSLSGGEQYCAVMELQPAP